MESMKKKSLFISYSRREAPFADTLLDTLEDVGYDVWLDYHSLIPGKPWKEQIFEGIQNADVILLIISEASMSSPNVGEEQEKFTNSGKRIILVIFEAVKLPAQLQGYEWVDFRGNFKNAMEELMQKIESSSQPVKPPPQKGFKAPVIVWVSFLMSLVLALISIPLAPTVFIPYFLIPLPYKIFKRNYDFSYIQTTLIALPFVAFLADQFLTLEEQFTDATIIGLVAVCSIVMLALLRSPGMRRWGKPIATPARFSNLLSIPEGDLKKVTFTVDYASEDKPYANEVIQDLTRYGHTYDESGMNANKVFVLISTFKKESKHDSEKKSVFPVILQTVPEGIHPDLKKIQWIDFRRGIGKINTVAKLISEPAKMLKAIGATPTSNEQTVLPTPVQAFVYLLIATAAFTLGGWLVFLFNSSGFDDESTSTALISALFLIPLFFILYTGTRSLVSRRGWVTSFRNFIFALVGVGLIFGFQYWFGSEFISDQSFDSFADYALIFGPATFGTGLVIAIIIAAIKRDDLIRWFPAARK